MRKCGYLFTETWLTDHAKEIADGIRRMRGERVPMRGAIEEAWLSMQDGVAISLFVKDGGIAGEWHCVDEATRLHYRMAARPQSLQSRHRTTPAPASLPPAEKLESSSRPD
jgi:hypothetical protein